MNDLVDKDIEHLRLLAIFHFVSAGLALLGLVFIGGHFAIMQTVLSDPELFKHAKGGPPPGEFFAMFKIFYIVAGTWFLLGGVANLVSAVYLRQRKGRIFSMVVAGFNCLHMPLGTVLGVFTFIVLSRDSVIRLYENRIPPT
jgi:hypothetical protein